nr:signal peptide protein [Rhizobium sp. Q54]
MYLRTFSLIGGLAAALVATSALAPAASAAPRDKAFFQTVAGTWKGPGEIVAGKYKGTKFNCNLTGEAVADAAAGIKLDGTCRVGVFKQPMSAVITQNGKGYKGKFLDGADGKGLDIISGAVNGDKVVVGINRAQLNGAMVASLRDQNTMNITISVKVEDQMIPVIGLTLDRDLDTIAVGSIR